MAAGPSPDRSLDRVVLAFLFGLFLFLSPFTYWWAGHPRFWYLPYVLWLLLIGLVAWISRAHRHDV